MDRVVLTMKALVVEFVIDRPHVAAFRDAIIENALASTVTEPGCRQFDVCTDPQRDNVFFLYELYDDDAAIAAHMASAHFQHMNTLTQNWVEKKTVWRYDRIAPVSSAVIA
jgi:(4S)-4-hydroxy-5-phosphonooxypentane-2,3-dione isomerase